MRLLLLGLSLILCSGLSAQRFLVIQKATGPKQFKYQVGQEIGVKIKGESYTVFGELMLLTDSSMVVDDQRIKVSDVTMILDRSRVKGFRGAAYSTAASIPFFLGVTTLNNWINTGDRPLIDNGTWILTGLFTGVSAGLFNIGPKKWKIGSRWQLKSINTSFSP